MKHLHEIKQKLVKELDEIAERGELSAGSLDTLHKLTDTIKNIDKIEMLEGGGSSHGYRGSYGSYAEDGYSQARRRDSRGRYTSYDGGDWTAEGSYDGGSYNDGGSYDRGYSGRRRHYVRGHYSYAEAKSDITEQLHELMQEANGKEREAIQRCIKMLDD